MPLWSNLFRIFSYAFTPDPLSSKDNQNLSGGGVSQPDAMPDVRAMSDGTAGGRGQIQLRDTNEFVDLSTVTSRFHRYKEYERLRNMPEIETAMTIFADETCLAGDTLIPTPAYDGGVKTLKWLAENIAEDDKFLVYCYDEELEDYTLGWAYAPRLVKEAETLKIYFDDGSFCVATKDHRILTRSGKWVQAGELKNGMELMPFYRIEPRNYLSKSKTNQFPRIYSHHKGWLHERQFIDEWRLGKPIEEFQKGNKICRMIAEGLSIRQIHKVVGSDFKTILATIRRMGFSTQELKWLGKKANCRRVIGIFRDKVIPVYDLTVEKYHNFCTNWGVVHNCQKDENGRCFTITTKNKEVQEELEYLWFHRKALNMDQKKLWNRVKNLYVNGDDFWEKVINPENPKQGIINLIPLPVDTMYRIETTKGRLLEFQQSKEGPDYEAISKVDVTQATESDILQAKAVRFAPQQITHIRIGDDRKTFYPYGISLMEAARGPAHQLRLIEDSMVVYRLCLVGNTRIRTNNGYKLIKDLVIGDTVYSYTKKGQLVESIVENVLKHSPKPVYKAKSKHVEIIGTADHPVLVKNSKGINYVEIKNLTKDDSFIITTHEANELKEIPRIIGEKWAKLSPELRREFRSNHYLNKSELMRRCYDFGRVKQFLYANGKSLPLNIAQDICKVFNLDSDKLIILNKSEINSDRINLPKYVTEEFAQLFGFLCGDGHISKNKCSLNFATSEDKVTNEFYKKLMEKFFGKTKFELDKRRTKKLGVYRTSSKTACHILLEMGYICNHNINRIPQWVFNSPKSIREAFVRGFSDADGCERYTKKGTWFSTIELSNEMMIKDIKELWSSIGLCSGKVDSRLRKGGHHIGKRIIPPTTSHFVTLSELRLPEYEKINSVTYHGEEEVYDITVSHNCHNFIANGIPVHNSRAPERKVFYIDVQQFPPAKAEAMVERLKDQLRKKKVPRQGMEGASSIDERWHAPAADEDYWIPVRPNGNTRVETLPGASNLGEVDDTVYFLNKLLISLNLPKGYLRNEDVQATRVSLSAQDVKFARLIERLQSHVEDAIWEVSDCHLRLLGYPEEDYEDLIIKMTPPSDWRELTRGEVVTGRIQNAGSLKGSQLMSDYDILTKWMKYPTDEAKIMLARLKQQKMDDLKLQIIAQNPSLIGVGLPGKDEDQVTTEPNEQNPMLGGQPPTPDQPPTEAGQPPEQGQPPESGQGSPMEQPKTNKKVHLPNPAPEDVKKYNLDIIDFGSEQDEEEQDASEN